MKRTALAGLLLLLLWWTSAATATTARAAEVHVGSKSFTEGVLLGELAAQLVEQAGHQAVHHRQLGGTQILWQALCAGEIDVYPEYTGTLLKEIFSTQQPNDPAALERLLAEQGIRMTEPLGFQNRYALGMTESRAAAQGIRTISDLRDHPQLRLGFSNEFMDRQDGWPGLQRAYQLPQRDVRGLDHDLAYRGLAAGQIDVIDLYTTDAEIEYYRLRVLEDDRNFFGDYSAVLLYRADLEDRAPQAVAMLNRLAGRIDEQAMISMNGRVKLQRQTERQTAAEFLAESLGLQATAADESRWQRVARRSMEHLALVGLSLGAAIAAAIPLGIVAYRLPALGQGILSTVGMVQTIPSLVLLVLLIPLLGIGGPPAVAALFIYSLLPIVRNTHAGLVGIPGEIRESAEALGLPRRAQLWRIELPNASRSILAGIKTSAVINVGTATLGALVGAGGYGQPILTGIRLDRLDLILEGAIPAALLALAAQGVFELAERRLVPKGLRIQAVE